MYLLRSVLTLFHATRHIVNYCSVKKIYKYSFFLSFIFGNDSKTFWFAQIGQCMLDTVIDLLCQNNMLVTENEFIDVCTVQYPNCYETGW